jgi:lipopolysaccharide transport system ATP-binding protein
MTERSIDLRDVGVTYPAMSGQPENHALKNLNLRVNDGERVGIVGPNGAGKSTLLQVIAGVLQPTHGDVKVTGKVHALLTVGMGLREEATGRENLYLDGMMLGRSREQTAAKLDEMIHFAELGEFIDRPIRTYSTGMKTRLGFASLIAIEPEILIIDEALAVGDVFFGAKAYQAMKQLTQQGAIVLLVSHSLASINEACERCIWLDRGEMRMDGKAADVTNAYRETVHAKEEQEIARKFGDSGREWSKKSKMVQISGVEVRSGRDGAPRSLLEANEDAVLAVTLSGKDAGKPTDLRIWVERNDGIVLFDERVHLGAGATAMRDQKTPHREFEIGLGRLSWRPFIYQIHVEILSAKGAVAHNAAVVKIWSDTKISGGTPMLRDPIRVMARRT